MTDEIQFIVTNATSLKFQFLAIFIRFLKNLSNALSDNLFVTVYRFFLLYG